MAKQKSLTVMIQRVCRRYVRKWPQTPVVQAARRLWFAPEPTPRSVEQWLDDLDLVTSDIQAPRDCTPLSLLRAQAAAYRIRYTLDDRSYMELVFSLVGVLGDSIKAKDWVTALGAWQALSPLHAELIAAQPHLASTEKLLRAFAVASGQLLQTH